MNLLQRHFYPLAARPRRQRGFRCARAAAVAATMLSFLRLALLAAFVDGFGHYPADTHLDDCESDICWSGAACNWEPSGYRCECGMNGPLEYGHELSKSFEFSGDDSQFIKIDATFYAGGTRTGENDVLYLCNDDEWSGACGRVMEWDVDTYSGCPEQRHYETDYSYEHSMTFESSDGGCASDDVCTVSQPCFECVYHVHSCNRASDMGVHTGYLMYLKYITGADAAVESEYGGVGDVTISFVDSC